MHPSEVARHRAIIKSAARDDGTFVTSNLDIDDTARTALTQCAIVIELTQPRRAYERWGSDNCVASAAELRARPQNRVLGIRARYHVDVQSSLVDDTSRFIVFVDREPVVAVRLRSDIDGRRAERYGLQRALEIAASRGDVVEASDVRLTSHRGIIQPPRTRRRF